MSGGRNDDLDQEAMGAQDRIDQRWLEAREKRLAELPAMDQQRAEEYLSLERALAELPEHQAPQGWDAAVRAEAQRLDAAKRGVDAFDASEQIAEHARLEIAAHRTKTLLAEGSQPRISFEERDALPATPAGTPPTRIFEAVRPRRGRLLAVIGVAALAAAFCVWLMAAEKPKVVDRGSVSTTDAPVVATAMVAMSEDLGELSIEIQHGAQRSGTPLDAPMGSGAPTVAGTSLRPAWIPTGDTLTAQLVVTSARRGELRLYYKDGGVVARCATTDRSCSTPANDKLSLRLSAKLGTPGTYRVVYLDGDSIAAPTGDLDRDFKACAGCRVQMEPPTIVK